jgi:hypothetical protein
MLGIVKRTEEEFAEWLAEEWGFLCGLGSFDDEPLVLEPYQIAFLQNRSRFRWVTKSRQVGFSFLFALEALARCHLREKHTAVFVSYNLDEPEGDSGRHRERHPLLPRHRRHGHHTVHGDHVGARRVRAGRGLGARPLRPLRPLRLRRRGGRARSPPPSATRSGPSWTTSSPPTPTSWT